MLTRWNPFREIDDLFDHVSRSFGRLPAKRGNGSQEVLTVADWAPTVDISETDTEYQVKVELPEVRKEDVNVSVNQGVLTIHGERKLEHEETGKKYHRVERAHGSFARSFTLPDDVDETSIHARHKDGMLYVSVGKTEQAKPRVIEVKVA